MDEFRRALSISQVCYRSLHFGPSCFACKYAHPSCTSPDMPSLYLSAVWQLNLHGFEMESLLHQDNTGFSEGTVDVDRFIGWLNALSQRSPATAPMSATRGGANFRHLPKPPSTPRETFRANTARAADRYWQSRRQDELAPLEAPPSAVRNWSGKSASFFSQAPPPRVDFRWPPLPSTTATRPVFRPSVFVDGKHTDVWSPRDLTCRVLRIPSPG